MTLPRLRPVAAGLALLVTAALALLPVSAAAAHDQLVEATPAAGSTVAAATSVHLVFDAAVLELGGHRNAITVQDAAGRHFETACAAVDGTSMTVPVALGASGTYRVTWRAVSSDGHGVGDTYAFTYRRAPGAAAAAGRASSPCAGADLAAQPAAAPSTGAAILAGAIGGGVLLAAIVAVLVVVVRVRRASAVER